MKKMHRLKITCISIAVGLVVLEMVAQQFMEAKELERGDFEHLQYANFKEFARHILNISQILASFHVTNYVECAYKCLFNAACLSFNFAILAHDRSGRHHCHLLSSDKYNHSSSFVAAEEFDHFALASPCESLPCQNGESCRPRYDNNNGYLCFCHGQKDTTHCGKVWFKINTEPVCFGVKNDAYGSFKIQTPGYIFAFKLVHLSGSVTCFNSASAGTKWGCRTSLNTHITDANNHRLFPKKESTVFDYYLHYSSGFSYNSSELEFNFISTPLAVTERQEFRVWYGEDLANRGEENNFMSKSCIDVYGLY